MLVERKSQFHVQQRDSLALLRELVDRPDEVSDGFCHTVIHPDKGAFA
jgi:hypothetical protein